MSNTSFVPQPPAGLAFVDVPGCGKGYRAITTISRGSLILEEIPCIILQPGENTTQRINTLFNQLTTTQQQYFATLAISPPFLTDALDLNRKRFLTNALPCGRRAGLFLIAARFNSSCRPNMHYYWNETRSTMEFRAMRDIAPLEEVCIAYDPKSLLQPRVMRQEIIRRTSGFHCSCPACIPSLKGDLAGQDRQTFSDNTRNWLRSVILPPTPPTMSSPLNSIRTISEALQALHREELYHYRDTLFYDGFTICANAGDGNNAMLWLQRAYSVAVAIVGNTDTQVVDMARILLTQTAADYGNRTTLIPPPF